eukprot:COSAG02_NODE_13311_length_1411_cov_1.799543_1_plen_208_part_00
MPYTTRHRLLDHFEYAIVASELVARTKPQYKTRKRDDGRMTMGEEPVHVKRMRAAQEAETQAATQARREAEEKEFLRGAEDPARSTHVATCCEELLFVVQRQKRKMIPVHSWSAQVMGAAAKTLNDIMEIQVVYLGRVADADRRVFGVLRYTQGRLKPDIKAPRLGGTRLGRTDKQRDLWHAYFLYRSRLSWRRAGTRRSSLRLTGG